MNLSSNPAADSAQLRFIFFVANFLIGLTWIYHGVVPKMLFMETGELSMLTASGLFKGFEKEGVYREIKSGKAFVGSGLFKQNFIANFRDHGLKPVAITLSESEF